MIHTQPDPPDKQASRMHLFERPAMACEFGLRLVCEDARYARQVARAAFDELERLEALLSRFIAHSEISQINAARPGQPVAVSPETIECLQLAARIHQDTRGAFDIAYRSRPRPSSGDAQEVPAPLILDPDNHAVGVRFPGVDLDLGGLGKGYAIDRMVAILREWGIGAALVHGGQSTVHALGPPVDKQPWCVALRRPDDPDQTLGTLQLRDGALSGSGQHLHGEHVIDPRTGQPGRAAEAAWALAPTAAVADALSTAFLVLSHAEVEALCGRSDDVSAILLSPARGEPAGVVCLGRSRGLFRPEGGP